MWCSLTGYQVKLSQQLKADQLQLSQQVSVTDWSLSMDSVCALIYSYYYFYKRIVWSSNCTILKMFYWILFSLSANFFCVRKHPGDQVVVIYVSVLFDLTWWSRSNQVNTNRAANSLWGCGRDACLKEKTTNSTPMETLIFEALHLNYDFNSVSFYVDVSKPQ